MRLVDLFRRSLHLDQLPRGRNTFIVELTDDGRLKAVVRAVDEPRDPQAALVARLAQLPLDVRAQGEWTNPVERCPYCSAHVLINGYGRRWCSYTRCDWTEDAREVSHV